MKKEYQKPVADVLCFCPLENLAINFDNIYNVEGSNNNPYGNGEEAVVSALGDIKIDAKK